MSTIILDLEADRVLAAEVTLTKGSARVVRAFTEVIPEGMSAPDKAGELGAWLRERLDESGMKSKNAIVAATRAEVLVKRLDAPADSLSPAERHEMVHLQMSKQASLAAGSSVVDYVESDAARGARTDGDGDDASSDSATGGGSGFIVASAMPTERVTTRSETVRAAGLKLVGIRLRTAGVRALVSEELDADRPTLLVNPSVGSAELLMLVGGEVVSSRSVAVGLPGFGDGFGSGFGDRGVEEAESYAQRVAVEASRTLVSFRVMDHGGDIDRAVVLSGGSLGRAVSDTLAERLSLPAQTLDPATLISFDEGVDGALHPALAPLAGLLLCAPRGIATHDFANPTGPPDTRAGLRQIVLAAVFALVVLGGLGYVLGQRAISGAERERAAAKSAYEEAVGKYVTTQLAGARFGHLRAASDDGIDWPAHLERIIATLPDAESVALGQIAVRLDASPRFVSGKQLSDPEAWSPASVMSVSVSGVARDRAHIAELRQRLLDTGLYIVTSQGPEVEDRFALQIATALPSPVADTEPGEDKGADASERTEGDAG